jgi:hypothetical protein
MKSIDADKLKKDKTMFRKTKRTIMEDKTMFRKTRRRIIAMTCVIAMGVFNAVPVSACTPPLNPPSVKIPDINFEPDGALKDAIDNAVKNWLEKCILGTPTVNYASYYKSTSRYFHYSHVAVKWSEVENATSYKVRITKADGTYKEFDTTHTSFYSTNYNDDFIADGMDGAAVSVKAYGDNDTFGCWSDDTNITRFGSIYRKEN